MMTEACVDAVLCIRQPDSPIDLHMIEIMHMRHKLDTVCNNLGIPASLDRA